MIVLYFFYILLVFCLFLRYRIKVKGLDAVRRQGNKGILFLPNHPALIDPVILNSLLFRHFHPRALVDEKQIRQTILKSLGPRMRILPLPDMGIAGRAGMEKVLKQIDACADALKAGDNLLLYPAGRIYHSRLESLRGNGAIEQILAKNPDTRIVLVRTTGLWGSSFSRGRGYQEPFMRTVYWHIRHVLANLIFFGPRREVTVEFTECPADFPRHEGKEAINRYLEKFYNQNAPYNTYVPYYWWEKGGVRVIPEPDSVNTPIDTSDVPDDVRQRVYAKLHEMTDKKTLQDSYTLGTDLGMDSIMIADILVWVQTEFGQEVSSPNSLRTVGSVLKAAIGQSAAVEPLRPVPPTWFIDEDPTLLQVPPNCPKITDTFLALAKKRPNFPLLADQHAGVITNRKAVLAVMVLAGEIAKLPDERLGIVMPASAASCLVFMAVLFAGKTPVMVNWTVGPRNLAFCLDNADCHTVLTSKVVIEGLEGRGTDLTAIKDRFVYLEDIRKNISLLRKLSCLFQSRFCWGALRRAKVPETAVILFTSGSENRPKTVPLTHKNLITDVVAAMSAMGLRQDDCMIGMLPPFHSFGLLLNIMMPVSANLRVAFHANPMEGAMLARIIAAYKVTMIVGTPTFAAGIFRNSEKGQLASVRILITGGEKCPEKTYRQYQELCPGGYFLEGYGITECSPVVALNRPGNHKDGAMGPAIPCLETKILLEDGSPAPLNTPGLLYVRGDSVFGGYLNYDGPSPFVKFDDGPAWYCTGDIVKQDEDGFLSFAGRKKRFCKVGGEMISLPAIEQVLMDHFRTDEVPIPLAVEAVGPDQAPEITLFSVVETDRETVNALIRNAGYSPIHFIRNIIRLPEIPLLGSGKTDYRSLKELARNPQG